MNPHPVDPDSLELAMARAIALQALDEARQWRSFHGEFHGFVVDGSALKVRQRGGSMRLCKVVVRLGGQILDQKEVIERL